MFSSVVPFATTFLFTSFCKRFRPLAAASYKHLHKYLAAFYSRVLDVTLPNIVRFPRCLEASRRKDHVVSEVISHVKFVVNFERLI
jgi:hypothetical protein